MARGDESSVSDPSQSSRAPGGAYRKEAFSKALRHVEHNMLRSGMAVGLNESYVALDGVQASLSGSGRSRWTTIPAKSVREASHR
jgi:hypothetical protein